MKKQKENSREGITWSEMGKQNVQAEKVYWAYPTQGSRAKSELVLPGRSVLLSGKRPDFRRQ